MRGRPRSAATLAAIELVKGGVPPKKAAIICAVSHAAVYQAMRRDGIPCPFADYRTRNLRLNTDPAVAARRRASIRAVNADPVRAAKRLELFRRAKARNYVSRAGLPLWKSHVDDAFAQILAGTSARQIIANLRWGGSDVQAS